MELLDDLATLDEASPKLGKSKRTHLQRMMARREVAFVYFGKKPYINIPMTRAALMSRVVKPVGGVARGRRR